MTEFEAFDYLQLCQFYGAGSMPRLHGTIRKIIRAYLAYMAQDIIMRIVNKRMWLLDTRKKTVYAKWLPKTLTDIILSGFYTAGMSSLTFFKEEQHHFYDFHDDAIESLPKVENDLRVYYKASCADFKYFVLEPPTDLPLVSCSRRDKVWTTHDLKRDDRRNIQCIALSNGDILATGGTVDGCTVDVCEIWNPWKLECRRVASLPICLLSHEMCLMPDGRVFLTGGDTRELLVDGQFYYTSNKKYCIYDVEKDVWTEMRDCPIERANLYPVRMLDDRVMIIDRFAYVGFVFYDYKTDLWGDVQHVPLDNSMGYPHWDNYHPSLIVAPRPFRDFLLE